MFSGFWLLLDFRGAPPFFLGRTQQRVPPLIYFLMIRWRSPQRSSTKGDLNYHLESHLHILYLFNLQQLFYILFVL
jgi:hypothetical protein